MSYTYNDATMLIATQVAYLNFSGDDQNVGAIVDSLLEKYGTCVDGKWELKPEYKQSGISTAIKEQFDTAVNIVELTEKNGNVSDWRDWTIVDVCNDQNDSGYYGLLIDTGDGNAIIGCRGSESTDFSTGFKDWGEADLGLLDSTLTKQQEVAQKYMEEIWYEYGDRFDTFSPTGHSLGGNLAEHMTIMAPAAMRDRIDHCISFDGPGYSEEYIEKYKERIEKVSSQIDHYQWSWVSSLLNPLPGVKDTIIDADDDKNEENPLLAMIWRHHTRNVKFNEDGSGSIVVGDESALSKILGPYSKYIDGSSVEELFFDYRMTYFVPKKIGGLLRVGIFLAAGAKLLVGGYYKLQELNKQWTEFKNDVYYNYILPQVSGEYEINTIAAGNIEQELENVIRNIRTISEEIDDIRSNMQYWSVSGSYYKSQLYFIVSGLEGDKKKLEKMVKVLSDAVSHYKEVDLAVADLFT